MGASKGKSPALQCPCTLPAWRTERQQRDDTDCGAAGQTSARRVRLIPAHQCLHLQGVPTVPRRPPGGQGLSVPPTLGPPNLRCEVPEGSGDHPTPALRTAGRCANSCAGGDCTVTKPPPQGPTASRIGLQLGADCLLREETDAGE